MKAVELNRTLECDDGFFNVDWYKDHPKYADIMCGWKVLGGGGKDCGTKGKYWCVECGLVTCEKHRKGHRDSPQHRLRIEEKSL